MSRVIETNDLRRNPDLKAISKKSLGLNKLENQPLQFNP